MTQTQTTTDGKKTKKNKKNIYFHDQILIQYGHQNKAYSIYNRSRLEDNGRSIFYQGFHQSVLSTTYF